MRAHQPTFLRLPDVPDLEVVFLVVATHAEDEGQVRAGGEAGHGAKFRLPLLHQGRRLAHDVPDLGGLVGGDRHQAPWTLGAHDNACKGWKWT